MIIFDIFIIENFLFLSILITIQKKDYHKIIEVIKDRESNNKSIKETFIIN